MNYGYFHKSKYNNNKINYEKVECFKTKRFEEKNWMCKNISQIKTVYIINSLLLCYYFLEVDLLFVLMHCNALKV